MKKKNIFRKVSLERLSSPEQLDQLMQVTRPRGWVALGALGGLIVLAVLWGFVGVVPSRVAGQGMLIRTGGVVQLVAPSSGRVTDVAVRAGDAVEAGQVVARIDQPALVERLQQARAELSEMRSQQQATEGYSARDVSLRLEHLRQQRANVQQSIEAARTERAWLQEKVDSQEQLLEEGLITEQQLIDTQRRLLATEQQIGQGNARLQEIEVESLSLRNEAQSSSTTQTFEINEKERLIAQLEEELRRKSQVISPYTGQILEVVAEDGDLISESASMMSFTLTGREVQNLEAVVYVSAQDGKKVKPGMEIQIAPATVRPEEYGRMIGTVTYVSDFPATSEGMMQLLENQQLVEALSAGGAVYEVHADLTLDPEAESGYKWTSSGGPPIEIQSGTLAGGTVTVEERHPIEMVLPVMGE